MWRRNPCAKKCLPIQIDSSGMVKHNLDLNQEYEFLFWHKQRALRCWSNKELSKTIRCYMDHCCLLYYVAFTLFQNLLIWRHSSTHLDNKTISSFNSGSIHLFWYFVIHVLTGHLGLTQITKHEWQSSTNQLLFTTLLHAFRYIKLIQ